MKNIIVVALVLFLCVDLSAQVKKYNVSGIIKDKDSGETIAGAVVVKDGSVVSVSNDYGYYSVTLKDGDNRLSYQYVGYKSHNIELHLKGDTTITVMMSLSVMEMNDVVVHSAKKLVTTQNDGSVGMNFRHLKYMPALLGEQDVFKYLQYLPGVSSGKEGMSGLNIRGGSSDQTQILLDDVPIYNQSHAFGLVSIFSGEAIKSAELFKGYSPASYGGRLSGVASLRMRDGNRYDHKQSLQLGTTTLSGNLEGPIKRGKGSYLVSGRVFTPGLLLNGIYPLAGVELRTNYGFYDLTAKMTYDLGTKNTIYLSLYTGNDNFGMTQIDTDSNFENSKKNKIERSKAGIKWGNTIASLRLSTTLSPKLFLSNTLYYSYLGNNKYNSYENYEDGRRSSGSVKSNMNEIGLKSNFEQTVTSNYSLTYGVNLSKQLFSPQTITSERAGERRSADYGKRDLFSTAFYVNNRFTFDDFTLNAGLRASLYNNGDLSVFAFDPRVSLSYDLNKNSSLWVSYVENSQPLFSLNRYYFSIPVDYWIPFTDKNIQRSRQFALGAKQSFGEVLDLTAEVYYKTSRNLSLVYNSDDLLLGEGGFDLARGRAYGVELSAQYSKKRFSFMVSYAYSRSENNIGDLWRPYIYDAPHDLNVLAMYDVVKRAKKKHTLSVNVGYKSGLPSILSNEVYPSIGNENSIVNYPRYANVRLTDYFRVDINYSMEKQLRRGSRIWQISLLNASAHNNPYIVYKNDNKYKAMGLIPFMPSFSYKRSF